MQLFAPQAPVLPASMPILIPQHPGSLDCLIRKYTMWKSTAHAVAVLTAPGNLYRPSVYTSKRRHKEKTAMADGLDHALKAAGSDIRCWRGD